MSVIAIEHLQKHYGKNLGVEDVSLAAEAGEILGFVGPNGAGKSTTIKILLSFIFADKGTATVCGLDAAKDSDKIKAFTGYVPSDVRLYGDFKIGELLSVNSRFYGQNHDSEISRLCDLFEVDRKKRFRELSTGNKKKISIICALAAQPKVLVLDEPTNGLDPMMQSALFAELKNQTSKGVCVLLSSHNLPEVQEYCDRVAFIKKGKILALTDLRDFVPGKIVTVTGCNSPIPDTVEILKRGEDMTVLRVDTEKIPLLSLLNELSPADFTVEKESIESRFMKLYAKEESI